MEELNFFDPKQPYSVAWKTLPHWAQSGVVCFVTWRTADSLPAAAERRITNKRVALLQQFDFDPQMDWKEQLAALQPSERHELQWTLFGVLDQELDHNFGECLLRKQDLAQIVGQSLLHFDGKRYEMTDFIVMPNHVHVLVAFRDEHSLLIQCTAWKRYTARQIHQALGRKGEFWQVEQFDHLVRGPEQFEHFRQYIAENPKKARLPAGSYLHYSKP
jgi:type I restriction enzyme R subunit